MMHFLRHKPYGNSELSGGSCIKIFKYVVHIKNVFKSFCDTSTPLKSYFKKVNKNITWVLDAAESEKLKGQNTPLFIFVVFLRIRSLGIRSGLGSPAPVFNST